MRLHERERTGMNDRTSIGKEQEQGMNEDKEKQGQGNYKGHTRTSN